MSTLNTTRHIDAMATTARELEQLARRVGFYAKDSDALDAALKKGRNGVVLIFDADGNVAESFAIGDNRAQVAVEKGGNPNEWSLTYAFPEWNNPGPKAKRIEESDDPTKLAGGAKMALSPYEQVAGGNFQKAVAQSHEVSKGAGPTPTQRTLGVASDAALRAKQIADGAKERLARQQGMERNQRIADAQKEFWNKRKSA